MSAVNQSVVVPLEKYHAMMECFNAKMEKNDIVDKMDVVDGEQANGLEQATDEQEECQDQDNGAMDPDNVGAILPVKMKVGGVKLAKYLRDHSILKWDKYGRITSDDDMANTNITDVIRDALSRRIRKKPNSHMDRFYYDLGKNSIIPYAMIRNPKRLDEMKRLRGDVVDSSSPHQATTMTPYRDTKSKVQPTNKSAGRAKGVKSSGVVKKQPHKRPSSHLGWYTW